MRNSNQHAKALLEARSKAVSAEVPAKTEDERRVDTTARASEARSTIPERIECIRMESASETTGRVAQPLISSEHHHEKGCPTLASCARVGTTDPYRGASGLGIH